MKVLADDIAFVSTKTCSLFPLTCSAIWPLCARSRATGRLRTWSHGQHPCPFCEVNHDELHTNLAGYERLGELPHSLFSKEDYDADMALLFKDCSA